MMAIDNNQFRKHMPNKIISFLLRIFHSVRGVNFGQNVVVYASAKLERFPGNIFLDNDSVIKSSARLCACNRNAKIRVGKNTTIGFYTFVYSSSKIEIGSNCMIAPFVYIVDSNHSIKKDSLMNLQPNKTKKIIISDDVWIGAHSVILPGVTIKKGAVIAAGSIVNSDVGEYEIFGGVPAKKISKRI